MSAILEVKDLKTVIRDKQTEKTIIDVINFEIGPKEVVALVGESGCARFRSLCSTA